VELWGILCGVNCSSRILLCVGSQVWDYGVLSKGGQVWGCRELCLGRRS